jgi:hypothetical protein
MPVGKENTTHRHDLHSIEYPYVIQRFFGPEGLKGTGLSASKIFSPFGFYQELQVSVVDRFGEAPEGLTMDPPVNRRLSGLAYTARLRNYWDLSQAANVELGVSAITGKRERVLACDVADPVDFTGCLAVPARQSVVGADLTYRWRPLQQGLYKSFILQGELMRQLNGDPELTPAVPSGFTPAPSRGYTGGYLFARWQLSQRAFVGSRYDNLQDPQARGDRLQAASGYLEFWPSEFSKLVAGYERLMPHGTNRDDVDRIILQASFAVGPHKPHPF